MHYTHAWCISTCDALYTCMMPPNNGVIAPRPNTCVVKCKYYVSQKKMGSKIRSTGTLFNSLLYLNSRKGFYGLKYMYSVLSVIVDSLPGNTKNRESTRSWTVRVRLVHPWEACVSCMVQYTQYHAWCKIHNTNHTIACRTHVVGIKTSRHAHLRVMSHVPNSHVSQMNESCHALQKSCHAYHLVMF